jgi:cytochrome b6-f complex iron-sulfur subunit
MAQPSIQPKTIPMTEEDRTFMATRRGVLKGILGLAAALGLGSVLYGLYRFVAPGGGVASPVEIPLLNVPVGGSYTFQYGTIPAILLHEDEGKLRAFSLICTHMACTVVWDGDKKEFHCPCHDGFFDSNGTVISGPPPAPLERLRFEVRGEKVVVGGA